MAIYDILCEVKDTREVENGICRFNGYLEDYLSILEPVDEVHEVLSKLLEVSDTLKICVDLGLNVNKDAIANQIIRYKDSFKLPSGTIRCPYVIYGAFDTCQKAVILTWGEDEAYVFAKALYYVMSEPENEYEGTRNEIIALSIQANTCDTMMRTLDAFFIQNRKAGIVQRELDTKVFNNYEAMYQLAQHIAQCQSDQLHEMISKASNREACINTIIANWFLMKKFSYVQYMMDKNNLNRMHAGNVKKQRQSAKEKCDAINFISYSELWKMAKSME